MQTHKSGIEVVRRRCLNSIPFTICLPCMSGLSVFLSSGGSYFTWQAKSYIPSTIKNSNETCNFLALDKLAYQSSIENFAILIRYFWCFCFFHIFIGKKKYKFRFPTCCSVRTEESINIKVRKLCQFWLLNALFGVK